MAWIFLSDSMLMPSLAPMDKADPKLTLGRRTMQVRGRLRSHLTNFIENYGEGLDISEVEDTPFADYTCRFYATPEAFAEAMKRAMLDIDYRKFKDTSERPRKLTGKVPEKATEYHSVLSGVWSITQRVSPAGGFYGPYSADNPKGYGTRKGYRSYYSQPKLGQVGYSFVQDDYPYNLEGDDYEWWDDTRPTDDEDTYVPYRSRRADELLRELEGIPTEQWEDELTEEEFDLVKPFIPEARRQERRLQKMYTKAKNKRQKSGGRHRAYKR